MHARGDKRRTQASQNAQTCYEAQLATSQLCTTLRAQPTWSYEPGYLVVLSIMNGEIPVPARHSSVGFQQGMFRRGTTLARVFAASIHQPIE